MTRLTTVHSSKTAATRQDDARFFRGQFLGYLSLLHALYCVEYHHAATRAIPCRDFLNRLLTGKLEDR